MEIMKVEGLETAATPRRWTRQEYDRMVEVGILRDGEKLELIDGEILHKMTQGEPHRVGIVLAQYALQQAFGPGFVICVQLPLATDDSSEPEPDLAVLRGSPRDYDGMHPRSALLAVEVADTSLRFDRLKKASLYSRSGIPEYWIVNLIDGRLEVHRDPQRHPTAPFGWHYTSVRSLGPDERVLPLEAREEISVAELLPRSALQRD
jgi:Uma2 family endonuclease